jgi:CARDB
MRRRVAAGIAVVAVIVIVLIVSAIVKSQQSDALKNYGHDVNRIVEESNQQVAAPFFSALSGAGTKPALDVQQQLDELHLEAEHQAARAKSLSVPSAMEGAQRDLLLVLDLRAEGIAKVANRLRTATGAGAQQASTLIAGDMENFLASDVVYAQRVAPLIEQTLKANGLGGQAVAGSRFLPNIGWLEASTVQSRLGGQSSSAPATPGTHGSALIGVNVGETSLEAEPAVNHLAGGSTPTFSANVENAGESAETNVKVEVTVSAQGKQLKATRSINSIQPGAKETVDVPVENVPQGVESKVEVYVQPVPGETNLENNKASYLAIFGS